MNITNSTISKALFFIIASFILFASCEKDEAYTLPGKIAPELYGIWQSEEQTDKDHMLYYHTIYEFAYEGGYIINDKYYNDGDTAVINSRDTTHTFNKWTLHKDHLYFQEEAGAIRWIWAAPISDITPTSCVIDSIEYSKQ